MFHAFSLSQASQAVTSQAARFDSPHHLRAESEAPNSCWHLRMPYFIWKWQLELSRLEKIRVCGGQRGFCLGVVVGFPTNRGRAEWGGSRTALATVAPGPGATRHARARA